MKNKKEFTLSTKIVMIMLIAGATWGFVSLVANVIEAIPRYEIVEKITNIEMRGTSSTICNYLYDSAKKCHCEEVEIETHYCVWDIEWTYEEAREVSVMDYCSRYKGDGSGIAYSPRIHKIEKRTICYIKEKIRKN